MVGPAPVDSAGEGDETRRSGGELMIIWGTLVQEGWGWDHSEDDGNRLEQEDETAKGRETSRQVVGSSPVSDGR